MSELTEALEKLSDWIKNSQSSHARLIRNHPWEDMHLKPGLEREMIELYVEEMNFELPEEVYELYQWHDGRFIIGDYANSVFFQSFEDSFDCITDEWRSFSKFPIFFGDDCYYAIDRAEK